MQKADPDYDTWHSAHESENDIATPWHTFAKQAVQSGEWRPKVILEIGCGRGGFSKYMIESFPSVDRLYACDYSESALEIGRAKLGNDRKITWKKEDIQNLSFDNEMFDTIVSCETVEHVPFPLKALSEIYRVLKPGGRFVLTCPNYFNFFGIWCLYRKIIGKPYTEGGQPYVNYILLPFIYWKLKLLGFKVAHFHSSELVLPARVPKTFYPYKVPGVFKYFGSRTFYILEKQK